MVGGILLLPLVLIGLAIIGIVIELIPDWIAWCLFGGLFAWVIVFVIKLHFRQARQIRMFANANGWQTDVEVPTDPVLVTLGYTFPAGKLGGTLDGCRFWLHTLTPSNSSNNNLVSLDVLTVETPRKLPSLFILPIGGVFLSVFGSFIERALGLKYLHLEGDFNKYAAAYGTQGKEIESLEYLTPDVMRVIADEVTSLVLYSDRYIHISPNSGAMDVRFLEVLFQDAQLILKEILEKQK